MKNKGIELEKEISAKVHQRKTAVLISAKFLREFQCGQIDLAYLDNGELNIIEIKSSQLGIQAGQTKQKHRLLQSVKLLGSVLRIPVKLKFIAKR